jgi:hypothetical protein
LAEIVLGLASSHTPQMSTSAEFWKEHAARDERDTQLLGRDGRFQALGRRLEPAAPDVVVIVGDDQHERFGADGVPAIGLFTGERWRLGEALRAGIESWAGGARITVWITAGGALGGLSFELLDYIPAYRSPAGTGIGMAFATWNRDRAARTEQETAAP